MAVHCLLLHLKSMRPYKFNISEKILWPHELQSHYSSLREEVMTPAWQLKKNGVRASVLM